MMAKFLEENGYGFQGPGLKIGMVNDIFWSEIGSGFRRTGQYTPIRNSQEYPSTPSCQMRGFWLLFSVIIDLIYNNRHLFVQFLRTDGIKVRPHGFSGGK